MKKIISIGCILMALVCLIGLFPQNAKADSDVSYNNKKIISVVYDDSGSMVNSQNKYVYANYAMQTFCSLLDVDDELYITYMNQYNTIPQKIDISNDKIQSSVESIRNSMVAGGTTRTPYESVESAQNVLMGIQDSDERTEYYLVVITDGVFTDSSMDYVRKDLENFTDERMYNGTKPQVIYLGIGIADQYRPNLNVGNFHEFYASPSSTSGKDSIVSKMSEIADLISGRSKVNEADIKQVGHTLEITSPVPLSSIAALVQGNGVQITSVKHKETGKTLNVGRDVYAEAKNSYISLSSQSFLITASKENVPAGTYVLTFSDSVKPENVVIMFEPAYEIRLAIKCNGREIDKQTELDQLHERDKISVSYEIFEYGTDKKVWVSDLPNGTTISLSVLENGNIKKTINSPETTLHHYELGCEKTEIKASLTLPGFNPIETYISFTPGVFVEYTVSAEYGGSADGVKLKDIGTAHDLSILFTLYANGNPVTDPNEVQRLSPTITLSPDENKGKIEILSNGKIKFTPNAAPKTGFVNGVLVVDAICEINGVSASKTYFVYAPVYRVEAEYGSATDTIKLTEIGKQHDLSLIFKVYEDDVLITDKAVIESLGYQIQKSPNGNDGNVTVMNDGRIVFVPNQANGSGASFTVTVSCQVKGASATKTYTVYAPVYRVEAEYGSATDTIKLTEIGKQHDLSLIFKVYEDDVLITDKAVIESLGYQIQKSPNGNDGNVTVMNDGRIVFVPNTAPDTGFVNGSLYVTVTCKVGSSFASQTYSVIEPVYEIRAEYGSNTQSVKLSDIAKTHDLSIVFTIYRDGVLIADRATIEKLGYEIIKSPEGNDGKTTITDDGRIIFVPNQANKTDKTSIVTVTCKAGGSSESKIYTVLNATYKVKAEFGSDVREIHLDNIGTDHGLSIVFKLYEVIDEQVTLITDKSLVEALMPDLYISEDGNSGEHIITEDGKIIYIPNASVVKPDLDYYDVCVTCTVAGVSATESYRIILPDIYIEVVLPENEIAKNGFFGNTTSVAFYIVKDGKRLTKDEVVNSEAVILNERHSKLSLTKVIKDDGMIVFTPISETEQEWFWLFNYIKYWLLSAEDLNIQFSSDYGTKEAVMPVGKAPSEYRALNVWVPFVLCVILVIWMSVEAYCWKKKPKFPQNNTLYVGKIELFKDDNEIYYHRITELEDYPLKDYNTIGYRLIPNTKPGKIEFFSLCFEAANTGLRYNAFAQKETLISAELDFESNQLGAKEIYDALKQQGKENFKIEEIAYQDVDNTLDKIMNESNNSQCYIFDAQPQEINEINHIESATIVFYV